MNENKTRTNLYHENSITTNDDEFSRGKILDGVRIGLSEYRRYIEKNIETTQNQGAIKISLQKSDSKKEKENYGTKYYILTDNLSDRKAKKVESELFEREIRLVYSEKPNGNRNINQSLEIKILNRKEEEKYIILDTEEELEYVYLKANDYQLQMQKRAVNTLINQPLPEHTALQKLFDLSYKASLYFENNIEELQKNPVWKILTDEKRDGTDEQRNFVEKALKTKDFALLEGPPGSGKTTAIIELIIQLIKQNKRVLLVSATHVAVDNVIHRILTDYKEQCQNLVVPIRISTDTGSIRKERVEPYRLQEFVKETKQKIKNNLSKDLTNKSKNTLYENLKNTSKENRTFNDIILKSANLVGGTMIGILQHPDIRKGGVQEMFDVMIVDESSKVTFLDFLVPALYAKKWILVGDVNQLSPYTEDDFINENIDGLLEKSAQKEIVSSFINEKTQKNPNYKNNQEWKEMVGSRLSQIYQYRNDEKFASKIQEELNLLVPEEIKNELENVRKIALPSILEMLQIGIGETKSKNGYIQNKLIYDGFMNYKSITDKKFQSLTYQHRMHKEIAQIPRDYFYEGENLKTANKVKEREDVLDFYREGEKKVIWIPNQDKTFKNIGKKGRTQNINPKEVRDIKIELQNFIRQASQNPKKNNKDYEIAVITFYREQERELKEMLKNFPKQRGESKYFTVKNVKITLSTVDKFQGDEADMVLLSFTKNTYNAFYNSPNRLNVALTRARYKLVLFGNKKWFAKYSQSEALKNLAGNYSERLTSKMKTK